MTHRLVAPSRSLSTPQRAAALAWIGLCVSACQLPDIDPDDILPTAGGTSDPEDGGSSGGADSEGGGASSSDGDSVDASEGSDESGDPLGCTGSCEAEQLCFAEACHPIAFSAAFHGGTDRQTITAMAVGADDSILVAGDFNGSITIGSNVHNALGSGRDMFVAKLDPTGAPVWSVAFGSAQTTHQAAKGVAIDPDGNVILAGELQETVDFGHGPITSAGATDVFVTKLDADGNPQWSRAYGDAEYQRVNGIAVDSEGSIVLTGEYSGSLNFGATPLSNSSDGLDAYIVKLDGNGEQIFGVGTGSDGNQIGHAVAVDAEDHIVFCGEFRGTVNFGGAELSSNLTDVFAGRLAPDGTLLWALANGDDGDQSCTSVAVDADGNVGISGRFADTFTLGSDDPGLEAMIGDAEKFAAKLSADGEHVWSRSFGAGSNETGLVLALVAFDPSGNMILAGATSIELDFGDGPLTPALTSVYRAKLDVDGQHLWSAIHGSDANQTAFTLNTDAGGNVILGGEFSGSIDFGTGEHTSQANPSAFVARLLP